MKSYAQFEAQLQVNQKLFDLLHDPAALKELLTHVEPKPDVNTKDKYGNTPLLSAAASGHIPAIKILLDAGADKNVTNNMGRSPLLEAVFHGLKEGYELLLDAKADVNIATPKGESALNVAIRRNQTDLVLRLIDARANVNQPMKVHKTFEGTTSGMTPLMFAAYDCPSCIEALIKAGADPKAKNSRGRKAYDFAESSKAKEILKKYDPSPSFLSTLFCCGSKNQPLPDPELKDPEPQNLETPKPYP